MSNTCQQCRRGPDASGHALPRKHHAALRTDDKFLWPCRNDSFGRIVVLFDDDDDDDDDTVNDEDIRAAGCRRRRRRFAASARMLGVFQSRYISNHLLPVPGDGLPPHTPPPGPARAADPPRHRQNVRSDFGSVFRPVFRRPPIRPLDPQCQKCYKNQRYFNNSENGPGRFWAQFGLQKGPKKAPKNSTFSHFGPPGGPQGPPRRLFGRPVPLQPPFWAQIHQNPPKSTNIHPKSTPNHVNSQKSCQSPPKPAKCHPNSASSAGSCRFLPVPAGSWFPPAQLLRRFLMDAAVSRSVSN